MSGRRSWRARFGSAVIAALAASLLSVVSPASAAGSVIHVDISAAGADDGSSWSDAFTDLQDGLAAATAGDEVRVAQGTYRPHASDRAVAFVVPSGVTLTGGYPTGGTLGPDGNGSPTILSGDLLANDLPGYANTSDNSYWVVVVPNGATDVVIDGVIVRGGNQSGSPHVGGWGGGLSLAPNAQVSVGDSVFEYNDGYGVGIDPDAVMTMADSLVANNTQVGVRAFLSDGNRISESTLRNNDVGLYHQDGDFVLDRVQILDNTNQGTRSTQANIAMRDSLIAGNGGGGMDNNQSSTTIVGSIIMGNTTTGDGGGLLQDRSDVQIYNSVVANNVAGGDGGGISGTFFQNPPDGRIVNTVVANNAAGGEGGGLLYRGGGMGITNSVFAGNTAATGGGIAMPADFIGTPLTVDNSIVWGNTPTQGIVDLSGGVTVTVRNSDVQGWVGGVGNIDADPLFVGPGNYRLQDSSPAREAGDNALVMADVLDVDGDSDVVEATPDLDRRDRVVGVVDMGAHEIGEPAIIPGAVVVESEGDSGSSFHDIPLTLSRPWPVPIAVDWTTIDIPADSRIALSGADYVAAAGTAVFAPGETTATVTIEVLGDTVDEPPFVYGEWGLVTFSPQTIGTVEGGFFGTGVFLIIDDD